MPQAINGQQIRDQAVQRFDIELNYSDTGALRAQDIPYDGVQSIKDAIDATGGSGNNIVEINEFRGDDVNLTYNTILWGLESAVVYPSESLGYSYFSFLTVGGWDYGVDIGFTVGYAVNVDQPGSNIKLELDYWVVDNGVTPLSGTPTGSSTQTFQAPSVGNQYQQFASTLAINAAHVSAAGQLIVCRLKRDNTVGANHSGALCLVRLLAHQ